MATCVVDLKKYNDIFDKKIKEIGTNFPKLIDKKSSCSESTSYNGRALDNISVYS